MKPGLGQMKQSFLCKGTMARASSKPNVIEETKSTSKPECAIKCYNRNASQQEEDGGKNGEKQKEEILTSINHLKYLQLIESISPKRSFQTVTVASPYEKCLRTCFLHFSADTYGDPNDKDHTSAAADSSEPWARPAPIESHRGNPYIFIF